MLSCSHLCYFICSKDFDILGEKMVSCGMDHSLKIWSLETDAMKKVRQTKTHACKFFLLVVQNVAKDSRYSY